MSLGGVGALSEFHARHPATTTPPMSSGSAKSTVRVIGWDLIAPCPDHRWHVSKILDP